MKENEKKQATFSSQVRSNFFTGLIFLIPLGITSLVSLWVGSHIYRFFSGFAPDSFQGVIRTSVFILLCIMVFFVLISALGYLMKFYLIRWLLSIGEAILESVPLLNRIYGFTKQAVSAIFVDKSSDRVPVIFDLKVADKTVSMIGFLTNILKIEGEVKYLLFIPTAPNPSSGFCVMVKKEDIKGIEFNFDEGLEYLVSLGTIMPDRWKLSEEELKEHGIKSILGDKDEYK